MQGLQVSLQNIGIKVICNIAPITSVTTQMESKQLLWWMMGGGSLLRTVLCAKLVLIIIGDNNNNNCNVNVDLYGHLVLKTFQHFKHQLEKERDIHQTHYLRQWEEDNYHILWTAGKVLCFLFFSNPNAAGWIFQHGDDIFFLKQIKAWSR